MNEDEILQAIIKAEKEYKTARLDEIVEGTDETWEILKQKSEALTRLFRVLKASREGGCEHNFVPANNATELHCTRCGARTPLVARGQP